MRGGSMVITTFWIACIAVFCIGLVVVSLLRGYRDGFVLKVLELVSLFLCIPVAWFIAGLVESKISLVSNIIDTQTSIDVSINGMINKVVLFFIIFFILRILIMLLRPIFRKVNWVPLVGFVNKWVGALLGFFQAFIVLAILSFLLSTPLFANGKEVLEATGLGYVKQFTIDMVTSPNDRNLFSTIQKWSDDTEVLVEEDYQNIRNWMQGQNFTIQEQEEIITIMKNRSQVDTNES